MTGISLPHHRATAANGRPLGPVSLGGSHRLGPGPADRRGRVRVRDHGRRAHQRAVLAGRLRRRAGRHCRRGRRGRRWQFGPGRRFGDGPGHQAVRRRQAERQRSPGHRRRDRQERAALAVWPQSADGGLEEGPGRSGVLGGDDAGLQRDAGRWPQAVRADETGLPEPPGEHQDRPGCPRPSRTRPCSRRTPRP